MRFDFKITNMLDPIFIISIFSIIFLDLKPRIIISNCENKLLNLFGLISLLCPGLKDITTPDFSTPSFNSAPFNPRLFNHELFWFLFVGKSVLSPKMSIFFVNVFNVRGNYDQFLLQISQSVKNAQHQASQKWTIVTIIVTFGIELSKFIT